MTIYWFGFFQIFYNLTRLLSLLFFFAKFFRLIFLLYFFGEGAN